MPSRREQIQMSPEEIGAYLRAQPRMIVVSNGPGGMPHPVPMNFAIDESERVLITTFRKSQKVKNLERDPRATLLVESGASYADFKSVIVYADAEIIDEPATIRDAVRKMRWSVGEAVRPEAAEQQITDSFAKRVLVRFTPFKYVSWDHAKLGGKH